MVGHAGCAGIELEFDPTWRRLAAKSGPRRDIPECLGGKAGGHAGVILTSYREGNSRPAKMEVTHDGIGP
jgi:hypothetical protein